MLYVYFPLLLYLHEIGKINSLFRVQICEYLSFSLSFKPPHNLTLLSPLPFSSCFPFSIRHSINSFNSYQLKYNFFFIQYQMEFTRVSIFLTNKTMLAPFLSPSKAPLLGSNARKSRVICSKGDQMTVSITGATGFIGKRLVQKLISDDHKVRVLTRSKSKAQVVFPEQNYSGIIIAEEGEWEKCIQGSTAVVNLAGLPISTRWSPEIKREIKQSRINATSKVVDCINKAPADFRPSVLVSATAVGYYGTSETHSFDETSPSGKDYLSEVCREWEAKAQEVNNDVRLVLIRIGVVLGKDGGALAKMIPLFMAFAGGPLGSGQQWFSWIHLDDVVNLIYESLVNPSYKGVINGTAPNPVRLSEMCNQLGEVIGRPSWLPVPEFAIKAVLGEGASVVLDGQRVLPVRAQELGFSFKYPYVKDALRAIAKEM
ncbi:Epimerase family protein [Rhynchospora pubera]|uniref:Epimerase family protein n=1 Tax=Rhynchospora pubera TaxID=906938 RepID=A0AAV8E1E9_9POAL|nr:Epimerase family protein [Rhynchospora pubera]